MAISGASKPAAISLCLREGISYNEWFDAGRNARVMLLS